MMKCVKCICDYVCESDERCLRVCQSFLRNLLEKLESVESVEDRLRLLKQIAEVASDG